jgi:hypothetical protein
LYVLPLELKCFSEFTKTIFFCVSYTWGNILCLYSVFFFNLAVYFGTPAISLPEELPSAFEVLRDIPWCVMHPGEPAPWHGHLGCVCFSHKQHWSRMALSLCHFTLWRVYL